MQQGPNRAQYGTLSPEEKQEYIEYLEDDRIANPTFYMEALSVQSNESAKALFDDLRKSGTKAHTCMSDDVKLRIDKFDAQARIRVIDENIRVCEELIRNSQHQPESKHLRKQQSSLVSERGIVQQKASMLALDERIAMMKQIVSERNVGQENIDTTLFIII